MRTTPLVVGLCVALLVAAGLVVSQGSTGDETDGRELTLEAIPLQTDDDVSFRLRTVNGTTRLRTVPESAAIDLPDGREFVGLDLRGLDAVRRADLQAPDERIEDAVDEALSAGTESSVTLTGPAATDAAESLADTHGGSFVVYAGPDRAVYVQYTIEE